MKKQFDELTPADEQLFFSRGDPNDIRLGDVTFRNPGDYSKAGVAIIGCSQDEGVRRNGGRTGARFAPREIRRALYRYPVSEAHEHLCLIDVGDVKIGKTLEDTHESLFNVVRQLLHDGKDVVVFGGGNDIS